MAARFGDMLLEQRRRMGLSIQQVANTIKISRRSSSFSRPVILHRCPRAVMRRA